MEINFILNAGISAVLSAMLALTGCSGKTASNSGGTSEAASAETTESAADTEENNMTCLLYTSRVMRYELKKRGVRKLKVVYSKEKPITPADDMAISCKQHCVCPPGTKRKCTHRNQVP